MWIVAVDVGNSRTKFGLFDGASTIGGLPECLHSTSVRNGDPFPAEVLDRWNQSIEANKVRGVISATKPAGIEHIVANWPDGWQRPVVIDANSDLPLEITVEFPKRVGIDRLLGAIAVNRVRPSDRSAIVVSCGTATTVNVVTNKGAFAGGAILPGFELSALSLHHYTALLPMIPIEELAAESHEPLGRNTREALRSGLFWGQLGAVKELIAQLSPEHASAPYLAVCGGGAGLLIPHLPAAVWYPHLTLQGLVLAAAKSQP